MRRTLLTAVKVSSRHRMQPIDLRMPQTIVSRPRRADQVLWTTNERKTSAKETKLESNDEGEMISAITRKIIAKVLLAIVALFLVSCSQQFYENLAKQGQHDRDIK